MSSDPAAQGAEPVDDSHQEAPSTSPDEDVDKDEEQLFADKAILYRFHRESKEWKERGTGTIKILKNKENGRHHIVMRRNQTFKVCANHLILPWMELKFNGSSDRALLWQACDFSDGEESHETLVAKFKDATIAAAFKKAFEEAKEANAKLLKEKEGAEKKDIMGKALAQARNLYVEIIFLATFTVLALAVANLRQETDVVKRRKASTVFGRLYMAIRGVVSRSVKVKRAVMFERKLYSQDTYVYVEAPAPEPEPEPEPDPTPDVSPVADDTEGDTQTEDDLFGSNITIVIDESDDNTEDTIEEEEEPIHEFEPETPAPTPTPTPTVIDMAGPFDIDRIQARISNVKTKLAKRIDTVRQAMNALNENLNDVIICQESEVDVYLKQMGGQTNRGSLKFDSYLEGISIAKSHRNMWSTPITPPKTEFLFEVREKSHDQSISKISFGAVPVEKCVVKNFYLKIGYKKEADVFTKTFSLVSGAHKRQNFSMPIPLRFDTLTVIALDNNGNSTTICLPEFRVYQHTGLL